jgi:Caspase domain/Domain of unknown function (DUF4384)
MSRTVARRSLFTPQSPLGNKVQRAKGSLAALLFTVLGTLFGNSVLAQEKHALLIGVSSYPSLKEELQLRGPQNDVVLMRDVLRSQGFTDNNIRVLANGVASAQGNPTRAAIISEMKAVAQRAKRGDFVYLQFGGHGSQQPARPGKLNPEPDGLDEIFLPVDVGQWDGSVGSVQNAIRDEELGELINAIRTKGAFVWAIFDACHSGNITRGGSDDETRLRKLEPQTLGIPQKALDQAQDDAQTRTRGAPQLATTGESRGALASSAALSAKTSATPSSDGFGGFVFFYAAQTTETTPEKRLPEGHPDRKPYGVFTYTLAQVLTSNPGISYRQAAERVLQMYSAQNMRAVTPVFEGSAMDAPLFGQKAGEPIRQWRPVAAAKSSDGYEINAGTLQQFGPGAMFAVLPNAASKNSDTLGYMRASQVDVLRTSLMSVAYEGKPALAELPRDAVVRVVNSNVSLNLRVSAPADKPTGVGYAKALKIIEALRNSGSDGLKVEWVAANQAADLRLALSENQLWFVSPDGAWLKVGINKTPSIRLDDKDEAELRSIVIGSLQSIAKASNLFKISGMTGGSGGGLSDKLDAKFFVTRASTKKREEISSTQVPVLAAGDRLQLTVKNNHTRPLDVTVLAVDARYGITLLYPASANENNRIHPRDSLPIPGDGADPIDMNDATSGREAIVIIAVEAQPNSSAVNLGFLEQPSLDATRGNINVTDVNTKPVVDLFQDAGFGGDRTRGPARTQAADRTAIRAFNYVAKGSK